jgi:hypothetical protein
MVYALLPDTDFCLSTKSSRNNFEYPAKLIRTCIPNKKAKVHSALEMIGFIVLSACGYREKLRILDNYLTITKGIECVDAAILED